LKPATIIGWTGRGSLDDLRKSITEVLSIETKRVVNMTKIGEVIIISKLEPVSVARHLANLPGISWIAIGYEFTNSLRECLELLASLAKKYLSRNSSVNVVVSVKNSKYLEGDIILAANSKILSTVRGSRIDEMKPGVKFRVCMHGSAGACGVEINQGAGGMPISEERTAYCLVSGGRHSSAAAWMVALSGFSLRLVHIYVDDHSLRMAAKLYSELSYRIAPSRLGLEVVEGRGGASSLLMAWLKKVDDLPIFTGLHLECHGETALEYIQNAPRRVLAPLLLMHEQDIQEMNKELGLKDVLSSSSNIFMRKGASDSAFAVKRFTGKRADSNVVLDTLLS
jgi:adenylyl- and sulfurtransferase ThiI